MPSTFALESAAIFYHCTYSPQLDELELSTLASCRLKPFS